MHSTDPTSSNVPAFLIKLWKLVEDADCDDLISWSEKGNTFIIRHQAAFSHNMLPKYFKHNNMASFIRQLNMYGFRKVINYEKTGMNLENDEMEFCHQYFMKGAEGLLERIKRKIPSAKTADLSAKSTAPNDILSDLTGIRERQENMNNILISMKKENELLWRELSSLRQKHKTQEQIIQKVIHFLVTIVQGSKQSIGVKRKITHMLKDSPTTSAKRSRQLEVVRGKKPDFFISVSDDKATSPEGPVIHEVTELDHEEEIVDLVRSLPSADAPDNTQNDSQRNSPFDISSPTDGLCSLDPQSTRMAVLPIDSSNEEVLGIPMDFGSENALLVSNDNNNVISIPENSGTTNSVSEVLDLMSVPGEKSNVISIPEVSNVISIPESSGSDNNTISISSDGRIILSPSVVPFSPSEVTVVCDENSVGSVPELNNMKFVESVVEENNVEFVESEATKPPNVNITKAPDTGKSILLPMDTQNVKENNIVETNQKSVWNQNSMKKEVLYDGSMENQENVMQNNRQLAISDSTPSSETAIAKNTFSNHVLDVDEELEWLQGQLTEGLNVDSSLLLGLFGSDEAVNNAAQANQLNSEANGVLRDADSNIIGNELVQFTPSMLDIDFDDMENPLFLDYLHDANEVSMEDIKPTNLTKMPSIKQEKKRSSCCLFENNPKGKLNTSLTKSGKNSKGRGKRKAK